MVDNIFMLGLIGTVSILALLQLIAGIRLHRLKRDLRQQAEALDITRNDIRALFAGAVGEDGRIHRLETRARRLKERQEQLENNALSERPYEQAIRMVQKGSSVEDIISVCNLSKGEAELIKMMHGEKQADDKSLGHYH